MPVLQFRIRVRPWPGLIALSGCLLPALAAAAPSLAEQYVRQERERTHMTFYQCAASMGLGLEDVLVLTPAGERMSVTRRSQTIRLNNSDLDDGDFAVTRPATGTLIWSSCESSGCNSYELDLPYRGNKATLYRRGHAHGHIIKYLCERGVY